jgi:putative oxidoreductase
MKDLALLILRLTVGALLAGHGSQKLFGWFEGPGLMGTQGFMEKLGLRPGRVWGTMAALGEFSGGVLTALGFLNPLGPLNIASAMIVAARRAHWGKPVWASAGGMELPLTNLAAALALALAGPGRYSLDRALGIRMPRPLAALMTLGAAGTTLAALRRPEVAETVLEKASHLASTTRQIVEPGLEVETRPIPERAPTL